MKLQQVAVLATACFTLFYLPTLGAWDFALALALLVALRILLLERVSEGKENAQFWLLKGLFLLSLRMLCDFIAFLSSLTQQ